jgi:hypothetical protein
LLADLTRLRCVKITFHAGGIGAEKAGLLSGVEVLIGATAGYAEVHLGQGILLREETGNAALAGGWLSGIVSESCAGGTAFRAALALDYSYVILCTCSCGSSSISA